MCGRMAAVTVRKVVRGSERPRLSRLFLIVMHALVSNLGDAFSLLFLLPIRRPSPANGSSSRRVRRCEGACVSLCLMTKLWRRAGGGGGGGKAHWGTCITLVVERYILKSFQNQLTKSILFSFTREELAQQTFISFSMCDFQGIVWCTSSFTIIIFIILSYGKKLWSITIGNNNIHGNNEELSVKNNPQHFQ